MKKIDFVITWVDNTDIEWQKEKALYSSKALDDANEARYRDWNILKYWFRSIETNAPWVNKIHFVTCGHIPAWLNLDNNKINLVRHKDILDDRCLPTFNSCAIEMGIPNISNLSEYFVYFNDDMFINKPVSKLDFYSKDGTPLDNLILTPIAVSDDVAARINYNCTRIVNRHFAFENIDKRKLFSIKNGLKYNLENIILSQYGHTLGLRVNHQPTSLRLSTVKKIHSEEKEIVNTTKNHRFRSGDDVSQWLYQYWQLISNQYVPRKIQDYSYYDLGKNLELALDDIKKSKSKLICLNDTTLVDNFEKSKKQLIEIFEKKYPRKSSYEK